MVYKLMSGAGKSPGQGGKMEIRFLVCALTVLCRLVNTKVSISFLGRISCLRFPSFLCFPPYLNAMLERV